MVVVGCWPDRSLALGEWARVVGYDYKLYHKVVVNDNYLNFEFWWASVGGRCLLASILHNAEFGPLVASPKQRGQL